MITDELVSRMSLPSHVTAALDALPTTLHPMAQLSIGVTSLSHDSHFASAYKSGSLKKADYWKAVLEDSLDAVAKTYSVAARIFNNVYGGGRPTPPVQTDKDLAFNFVHQIGFGETDGLVEFVRLYNALHADHEGGNVSAHATHLVGSALADPFLSFAAGLNGLAGPLHGLANQEVLRFILDMQQKIGDRAPDSEIKNFAWSVLNAGRVIPGYGHAVLRKPDPRFTALERFGTERGVDKASAVFDFVVRLAKIAPGVLTEHGKTKNPFPNVDSASGALLYHYGLTQFDMYTVVFGTSRSMGALANLVWARALGLPIERPKSMSIAAINKQLGV